MRHYRRLISIHHKPHLVVEENLSRDDADCAVVAGFLLLSGVQSAEPAMQAANAPLHACISQERERERVRERRVREIE
jgi:hypothetical protein